MPTYDYECDACEHAFDVFQSICAQPLKKCPECGKNKLRRLFGAGAAVVFKGSGFYQTDYRSDSYKKAAESEKKSSSESSSSSSDAKSGESKSESKPAEKPAPSKSPKGPKGSSNGAKDK